MSSVTTNITVISGQTIDSPLPSPSYAKEAEEEGEEMKEEQSEPCERERAPVIKNPTPQQILSTFTWNDDNLFDHLKRLLEELIATRPENVMEYFDQYSRGLRFKRPPEEPMTYLQNCVKLGRMYGLIYPTIDEETESKTNIIDLWEYVQYFEEMGVCLPREEMYQITLSLRKLALIEGLSKIRFWGKIFGLERSYIVAECELTHDEIRNRNEMEEAALGEEEEEEEEEESHYSQIDEPFFIPDVSHRKNDESSAEEGEFKRVVYKKLERYKRPPIPKPTKPKDKKLPPEKHGEGTNKKVYYICHEPGDEWILLPNVKPEHIVAAKKTRKYLKGNLLSNVASYPPFKGTESELLRAQIARITAGTHISPIGYYQMGGGEEELEEVPQGEIVANLDYEPVPGQDLLKTSFWVHHAPHILRIGRTTYWQEPRQMGNEEMEEEINEEEIKEIDLEQGPPILTPISEDVTVEMIEPWTIKCSSMLLPATGVIVVRSNLWPGAYAFGKGRIFENIYIGWGIKLSVEGFNPHYLPEEQLEYEIGPEIMEITDPTPEMEDEWREKHKPPPPPPIRPEEEGEGGQPDMEEEEPD